MKKPVKHVKARKGNHQVATDLYMLLTMQIMQDNLPTLRDFNGFIKLVETSKLLSLNEQIKSEAEYLRNRTQDYNQFTNLIYAELVERIRNGSLKQQIKKQLIKW